MTMLTGKYFRLMLTFTLLLFTFTTTGLYAWLPVIAKNIDHHHQLNISVQSDNLSLWSLEHHEHDEVVVEDNKNHHWTSYDEPTYHHSVKPVHADDELALDPVFILSFITALIFLFLKLSEHRIRVFDFRKRIFILRNSYTYTKALIVLRN